MDLFKLCATDTTEFETEVLTASLADVDAATLAAKELLTDVLTSVEADALAVRDAAILSLAEPALFERDARVEAF